MAGIAGNDILTMIGEDVLNGHKVRGEMKAGKRKEWTLKGRKEVGRRKKGREKGMMAGGRKEARNEGMTTS